MSIPNSAGSRGRVRRPRVVGASDKKQLMSWFSPYGTPKYKGLVGQVFFPTNVYALDANDRKVLDALADHIAPALLGGPVELEFWGYADYRGTDRYNYALGLRRARAVKAHVDAAIRRSV